MLHSLLYTVIFTLLDRVVVRTASAQAQAIRLLALRHEVRVLQRRQVQRMRWRPGDLMSLDDQSL